MPDLSFAVVGAEPVTYAIAPLLNLKVRITNSDPAEAIQNILLRCQIQIETVKRQYTPDEKAKLFELYGEPERWGQTLKAMLWTHANVTVPPFSGETVVDLPVPCTFDFNIAATKYFDGLGDGEIPLCLLFSGTVFYHDSSQSLQIGQISWDREANFRLPVSAWKQMMAHYYPNGVWLNLRKDVFDKLSVYKTQLAIPSWEQTFERLLDDRTQGANERAANGLATGKR